MNIVDKITTTHYINFTEEDLDIIEYATKKVWSFVSVPRLIDNFDRGFAQVLDMISKIRRNVFYHEKLKTDDQDMLEILCSTLCSFEVKYEGDERFQEVDALWHTVSEAKSMRSE